MSKNGVGTISSGIYFLLTATGLDQAFRARYAEEFLREMT